MDESISPAIGPNGVGAGVASGLSELYYTAPSPCPADGCPPTDWNRVLLILYGTLSASCAFLYLVILIRTPRRFGEPWSTREVLLVPVKVVLVGACSPIVLLGVLYFGCTQCLYCCTDCLRDIAGDAKTKVLSSPQESESQGQSPQRGVESQTPTTPDGKPTVVKAGLAGGHAAAVDAIVQAGNIAGNPAPVGLLSYAFVWPPPPSPPPIGRVY
eukprot:g1553.t1